MLEIKKIGEKRTWESFVEKIKEKTFLQSWNWGEFQKRMGNKIWRLALFKDTQLKGICLVIKISAKRGKFLHIPHGPLLINTFSFKELEEIFRILVENLKTIAKKENCSFIRISPIFEKDNETKKLFQSFSFKDAPIHLHPEVTLVLDLSIEKEEILKRMRKNTRNLIRRAKKEGVEVFQENSLKGVEKFYKLYLTTAKRQSFVPFSFDYLKNEFLSFLEDDQVEIFFAKWREKILASAIIIFWQKIAFYHHGASIPSKIPASYLLQWEIIQRAKKKNCNLYNLWGIVPKIRKREDLTDPQIRKHPWWGLSLFKIGFGGRKKEYFKTQDLILSKKYYLSFLIEKLRKIKRGF